MLLKDHSPVLDHPVFRLLREVVKKQGVEAYAVGGFVRDTLLGREVKDIDVVVNGDGILLAKAVAAEVGNVQVKVFKTYGTAMLRYGDWELEFVGARKESYSSDSRKPSVEAGSIGDDQMRRDFTINALAIGLSPTNYGLLLDPFEGISDLKKKIIRTPADPHVTFSDDPLRMMRAIRFATQLEFKIEPAAIEAIKEMCGRIEIVSAERITTELNKIILSRKPSIGFKLLFDTGLLHLFFRR